MPGGQGRAISFALAAILVLGSCRLGYEPVGAADDGDDDDGGGGDGDGPGGLGAFGPASSIEELNGNASDDDPSLTGDLLEIYFKSDRGPGNDPDIWWATRASTATGFGPAQQVDELSSTAYDGTPEVALDGLSIQVASGRSGGLGGIDIWRSTRATRDAPWEPLVRVTELSSPGDDYAGVTDASETIALLGRDLGGGSGMAILTATRASAVVPWTTPTVLVALDTADYDADAAIDGAGRVIVFGSTRPGGAGEIDLWISERAATDEPFGGPVPLVELNTDGTEEDPWLSPDLRTLVFTRVTGAGQELFMATR